MICAQERIIAVALLLQVPALRDFLDRGYPSALRQRLVDDQDTNVPALSMFMWVTLPCATLRMMAEQNSSTSPS